MTNQVIDWSAGRK